MAIPQPDGSAPNHYERTHGETIPGRGPSADYCPFAGGHEGHHMVSRSGGQMVKWVEICSLCHWIDTAALDRWAASAIIEAMTKRAQRIAVAVETQPFAFVQPSSGDLPLDEILAQALAAASTIDLEAPVAAERARQIFQALKGEVYRALKLAAG